MCQETLVTLRVDQTKIVTPNLAKVANAFVFALQQRITENIILSPKE